ncbi:hypothetical protein DFH09DRAFT_1470251 [Mycena vulgaris]|nr:hypothetical protein DFH09DRAFT_1470251 [Mycena vulgaris]
MESSEFDEALFTLPQHAGPEVDPTSESASPPSLGKLVSLMQAQIAILREIEQRQVAADVSKQPIPQIPATSSSTWGALLRSTVSETIQPNVDRWRSGLDALLVFLRLNGPQVGLFSAIVTAFLVDSLPGLQQDGVARTNELLANFTEIIIQLSGNTALNITPPATFQPAPADVRLNSYWSVSLILSLCVAALAVTLRGFLNMLPLSRHTRAMDKIVDIKHRWDAAEQMLGPAIEMVPQLLVIPVFLFVIGLLDSIFSKIFGLATLPIPVIIASGTSLLFITGMVFFFAFTLLHASVRPGSSPFQSTLSRGLRGVIELASCASPWARNNIINRSRVALTYHQIVQRTHADDTLDKAAAALSGIIESLRMPGGFHVQETATLVHLLSTEASSRCNRTAAEVIVRLERVFRSAPDPRTSPFGSILTALTRTALRSAHRRPLSVLWTSPFLRAMAVLAGAAHGAHPPVVCILASQHVRYHDPEILDLLFAVYAAVCPAVLPRPPPPQMVALFRPAFIAPLRVLEALHHLTTSQLDRRAGIVALLVAAQTPAAVVAAAHDLFFEAPPPRADAVFACTTAGLVVKACLDAGAEPQMLADLSTRCVLGFKGHERTVGFLFEHFAPILRALDTVLTELPPGPAAPVLVGLLAAGDTSRWKVA